jgi:hypothetical protein
VNLPVVLIEKPLPARIQGGQRLSEKIKQILCYRVYVARISFRRLEMKAQGERAFECTASELCNLFEQIAL